MALVFVPSCGFCGDCAAGRPALCAQAAAANGSGALLHGPSLLTDAAGNPVHHQLGVSAFSEHAVLAQESVVPIPKDIPFTVASMFGCAVLTGAGAVINTAALRPGQSTVVYGLGGVGLSAVLGARAAGRTRSSRSTRSGRSANWHSGWVRLMRTPPMKRCGRSAN